MLIECACGCRGVLEEYDDRYRRRTRIRGHHLKGKHITEEHKWKISDTNKGKPKSKETRLRMSRVKKIHWKNLEYRKKIPHNGMLGKKMTEETKQKLRVVNLGKGNPSYGKPISNAKVTFYNGIKFKSTWEAIFAKWLDSKGFIWQYEPKRFFFDGFSYLPDFFVKEFNSYVEIKGFWRGNDREKVNAFVSNNNNLIVIENIDAYTQNVSKTPTSPPTRDISKEVNK